MSEWKELKIDKLPEDILTGDYEFNYGDKYSGEDGNFEKDPKTSVQRRINILQSYLYDANCPDSSYVRYRKPEPKAPTHEEIIKNFWVSANGNWLRVTGYTDQLGYFLGSDWEDKEWFTGRKSAEVPPES